MVGEMRDKETAQIAIQSALTGHLVFSTVHTNNAPATITRLIDMGIEPFLVSSTIIGVLAQRLVRRICPDCRKSYKPHPEQLRELGIKAESFRKIGRSFYRGAGCDKCRNTGYRGRLGIHELLEMSEGVKNTILESSDSDSIKKQALKEKMITLRRDGVNKILHGLTTAEEILSITTD
jgi:type II secretory ATPase GspE/PulE/Tfp pilus assembly ATPase PilB-like protein